MNNMNNIYNTAHYRQQGLTLVEILVALMISAFLLGGVIQLFIGSKQTYRTQDGIARIQENGRFALDSMARDLRMAGYYPRVTTKTTTGSGGQQVTTTEQSPEPNWSLVNGRPISQGQGANAASTVSAQWENDAGNFITRTYSLAPRTAGGQAPTCPGAANSLFLAQDGNAPQELVEGVQLMRIFYGVDTNPNASPRNQPSVPRVYVPASGITGAGNLTWNNVVSIKLYLLLVSLDNNLTTAGSQTVMFPSATNITPVAQTVSDRCLGQVFSTTIAVRNFSPPVE